MPDALVAYGLDDRVATLFSSFEHPDRPVARLARIVRVDRTSCLAVFAGGIGRARVDGLTTRQAGLGTDPVTGDWVVVVDEADGDPSVVGILTRRSALSRRAPDDRGYGEQVLAANIDVLAVTVGLDRPVSANRIERTLVIAWEGGTLPVIVLTKADLAQDLEGAVRIAESAASGVEVLVTSATTGEGAEAVTGLVADGGTLAFLGPSGAGKSTLVNRLVGSHAQRIGPVRDTDQRGRHTTTSRELVPIPAGGVLLDTPGLRSLGLLDAEGGISSTFADVETLAATCRFSDCAHAGEPGCAVQAAISSGILEVRRLESYQKLLRELERDQRRQSGLLAGRARRIQRAHIAALQREAGPARFDERRQRGR